MAIKSLKEKLNESVRAVLPVTLIVLLMGFTIAPKPVDISLMFVLGAGFIVLGIAIFALGAEMAMAPMGNALGDYVGQKKNILLMVIMGVILGFMITIAEPSLIVMAEQVTDIPFLTLIATVAAGVGIFLAIAFLRTAFNLPLKYILFGAYILIFSLAFFVPDSFLSVAFDSGGATTGCMTVPFIMALGVGVARMSIKSDSFGLIAICSIGPILTVMVLGLIYTPTESAYSPIFSAPQMYDTSILWAQFMATLPSYMWEVSIALAPIVSIFIILKVVIMKVKIFALKSWQAEAKQLLKIFLGVIFTFVGLVIFLTGANVGFVPAGNFLGQQLAGFEHNWLLIPISMLIGFFIIAAEPSVYVLNKQVADVTKGAISKKAMSMSLSIGVAIAVGLASVRVLTHLHIMWILLPGYALAIGLSFLVPPNFTSIAFDAGGVASGSLTSAFLLPLAIGASTAVGGNVATDAFGIIAMVALTPLVTIQVLGLYYKFKTRGQTEVEGEEYVVGTFE